MPSAASSECAAAGGRRVLVVDDQAPIVELLGLYLEEAGYEVGSALNAAGALTKFSEGHWDLVITDRMMPGQTGDDLARALRRIDPEIPVILVSGFAAPEHGSFCFNGTVAKPFTKKGLLEAVDSVLAA